jgi:hypothetical protein
LLPLPLLGPVIWLASVNVGPAVGEHLVSVA